MPGHRLKEGRADHMPKLRCILSALDVAESEADLAVPSFRAHSLKGDKPGRWLIWVSGTWRVTFRFIKTGIELVDYEDYH
jgi:toxin HigB-1